MKPVVFDIAGYPMRQINRIDFQDNLIIIRYKDDANPKWVSEQVLTVKWRNDSHVERLVHVGYHIFLLLVERPDLVATHDEILTEWLGRLFDERPIEGHEAP